ncbi:2-hydroxyacid dehydrogenase [Peribacillus sp. SCS-26]|uniref:2-hydroxyacid dehydrogenase n=1 Tax=Paraperibacillus marinus TaxID=3115295 RepID=UPI00390638E1
METKPYIYITRKLPEESIRNLYSRFHVSMWDSETEPAPRDVLLEEAGKADALLTMLSDRIDREVMEAGKNLKVIANLAVGYDNIDLSAAKDMRITVCNTPEVLTDTTADLTFGLMLAAARRINEAAQYVKEGNWKGWSPLLLAGYDVHHKTIGIVGMGKIGQSVARRARGFDMDILYHNRTRNEKAEHELGARYSSFGELIERADFIVCLTPLTPETKGLFNADSFKKMKKTAVFVNASRGPVVDEDALYEALTAGDIAAAGLDVFEQEPISADHPLLKLDNVTAIPHIGSSSVETRMTMMALCSRNIEAVLTGDAPATPV